MANGSALTASGGLVPVAILGAIIGSFLNVVIYRLPLGLSVFSPKWSFCPKCRERIRPTDNIPILGWLRLKGRCRACSMPIESAYPLIEALSVLVFVTVWDVLFTSRLIPGVGSVSADGPLAIAYLTLFAGLLASAAMDIESYMIDIRISVVLMIVAVIAYGLRGIPEIALAPASDRSLGFLPPGLCIIAAAMGLTWFVIWAAKSALSRHSDPAPTEPLASAPSVAHDQSPGADPKGQPSPSVAEGPRPGAFQPIPIVILTLLIAGLIAWQLLAPTANAGLAVPSVGIRCTIASMICMIVLILSSWVTRPADAEIAEEIEHSRHAARAIALREITSFAPSLIVGLAVLFWLRNAEQWNLKNDWPDVHRLCSDLWPWAKFVAGGLLAVAGMVIGSAIGWTVRVLGTLAFGKEAFGTGDIYLMAAIGAAAGVGNLVFGFFLAALLALVGVVATAFRKSSRIISFGPWLAMGAFVALPLEGFLLDFFKPATALLWNLISGSPSWRLGD